jgi:hypothetical protein
MLEVYHDQTINESVSHSLMLGPKMHHKTLKIDNFSASSLIESRHSSQSQNSIKLLGLKKERKLNLMEQKNLFVSQRSSQAFTE